MKRTNCTFATALTLAISAGSTVADEQCSTTKIVSQPTVMSDAELDQIVGAGAETYLRVSINRTKSFEKSGFKSQAVTSKSQGQGLGASGAWFGISLNPSP